ncbi:phosphotransferase [Mycobacterium sp. Aquia_216]|uniref:phosphotransferase n=1 Tax=Mycobacterium sp. Aquia_216 TaxID=2991729 RepID=UPI00227D555F|nr:phosphotransferase [Mycobacterium sp. Aquia_216]WAJ46501.1 phosphotransferase [Mycobacterium sp. Aquia_216]
MPSAALPLQVEQITPEWLGASMSTPGREVRVRAASTTGVVWGTATKVMLDVVYASGGDELPSRLCVKGGFVPEMLAFMAPGYQAEARFYRDVAPLLGEGLSACHFAGVDDDSGQGIVILDDLATQGAAFCDARQPLSVDQVGAALELLARWHARTDLDVDWLDAPPHYRPMAYALAAEQRDGRTDNLHGAVGRVLTSRERLLAGFQAMWADEDRRPRRFIHGDANLTNVYLDAAGEPRFLDWQFAGRGDAYHDVAFFLIGALSSEDRRSAEERLLRSYLAARGSAAETFDVAWDAYRRHALYGIIYALTPEAMQPAEIRDAMSIRFAQAVLDHNVLSLLGV